MNKDDTGEKVSIPYNTDTAVLEKILNDLKNTGSEGVNLKTLWANIDESGNLNKSYTLNMAKFLGLVDTDGTKIWLTSLGRSIGYLSGDKRNSVLAKSLPETYMTMFKWILYSPAAEMFANDMKAKFVNIYGSLSSPVVLDRAVASFLSYCQYIGLLKFAGKGRGAKATLTDFGKTALDMPTEEGIAPSKAETSTKEVVKAVEFPTEASYPIRIITRDRVFDWDIKSESDLNVIDSVITSIREGWKNRGKMDKTK